MRVGGCCCVVVVVSSFAGCTCDDRPPPQQLAGCEVTVGGASRIEALQRLSPTVQYFLDVDGGGPLTCAGSRW